MHRGMTAIEALARRVAEAEHEALPQIDPLRVARERLAAPTPRVSSRRAEWLRNGAWAMVGAMAAVIVIAVVRPEAPGFQVHSGGVSKVPLAGEPILATESAGAALQFSDGSTLRLEHGAQVRVGHIDKRGALVSLDQGHARVHVVHQSDTRWVVSAGPFQVKVTGTTFDLSWEPDRRRVRIDMMEGAVSISGCALAEVVVPAGQSLEATCDGGAPQVVSQQAGPPAPPERSAARVEASERRIEFVAPAQPAQQLSVEGDSGSSSDPVDAGVSGPGWRALAAAGRLKDAFEAAEAQGFDGQCTVAAGDELLSLSDAALVAHRNDRARQALLAARTRFPASPLATTAAFRLGRLAFDRGGSAGEAGSWFRTYLAEQPGGGFAREAWGRLIEVEQRSGNTAEARRLARDYLRTWPQGPHAPLARSLVGD